MKISLSIPPSVNHCYFNIGPGRRALTTLARRWKNIARIFIIRAIAQNDWKQTTDEKIVLEITVFWPDKRRRDCSNLLKLLEDSMTGLVYDDDSLVLPRFMDFQIDRENPRIELDIYVKRNV